MPRSLRSRLILASLLWTAGLLLLMHILSLKVMHVVPRAEGSHATVAALAALALMAAGVVGLRQGLKPFRRLPEKMMAGRGGGEPRVQGAYPCAGPPLVYGLDA